MTGVISFFTRYQYVNTAIVANYILLAVLLLANSAATSCEPMAARLITVLLWILVLLIMAYIALTNRSSLWWMVPQIIALGLGLFSTMSMTLYRSHVSGEICFYNNTSDKSLFAPLEK